MRTYRLLLAALLSAVTTVAAVTLPALPARANTPALCQDGLDDDADGLTDYPADPGCSSGTDSSERGSATCDNGVDEDQDGLADAPLDTGCSGPADSSERRGTGCDDGVDNDGDGRTDFPVDSGCLSPDDGTESDECAEPATVLVCPTVGAVLLDQVVPAVSVEPGEHHAIRGYVDAYEFVVPGFGSHTVPCVVLSVDVTGALNACASAGGMFRARRLTLLHADPQDVEPKVGGQVARVRVCSATYEIKVLGFGPEALPGAALC